jgi:hypothetical protein
MAPRRRLPWLLRHDDGTQFTSEHYREVAQRLGLKLSRTRYRHPDGNALVERIFLSLKREEVWPQDFASFAEAKAAVTHWILDYKHRAPAPVAQVSDAGGGSAGGIGINAIRSLKCQPEEGSRGPFGPVARVESLGAGQEPSVPPTKVHAGRMGNRMEHPRGCCELLARPADSWPRDRIFLQDAYGASAFRAPARA